MKLASRTLPYFVLAIALAIPAYAQDAEGETGELSGVVYDFRGEPLEGAAVRTQVNGQIQEFPTAADGAYSATLPAGSYTLTLLVQRQPLTEVPVEIPAGGTVEGNFDLSALSEEDQQRALEMLEDRGNAAAAREAFNMGREALAAGNLDQAIEHFTVAAEADDQHVILANLAQALAQAGRHQEAAEQYQLALLQDPENSAYLQNMGISLGNAGDVEAATDAISRAAALDPLMAGSGYYNLGIILINRGQTDGAINAFRQSIEADENNALAYYQLGLALVGTAPADAVEPLEKFLELAPDDPNATTAQGLLEFAQSQ